MPQHGDIDGQISFINQYICAQLPIIDNDSTNDDKRYEMYIRKHMMHNCAVAINGCKKSVDSLCRRGYETTIIGFTQFDNKGYPVYARSRNEDLRVVPHNRLILLDWDGHANVEYSGGVRCIMYLYKYLFKGQKKSSFQLINEESTSPTDEISIYLKGRFLCSMDAMWRFVYILFI